MKNLFSRLKKVLVFMLIIPVMFVFSACGKKKNKTQTPSGGIEQPLPEDPETPGGGGGEDDDGDDPVVPEVQEDGFSVELNYDLPNYIADLLPDETKSAKVNEGYALPTFIGTEYENFFDGWYSSDVLNEDSKIEEALISGVKDSTVSVYAKWKESDIENYFYTDGLKFDYHDDDNTATVKIYEGNSEIVVIPQVVKVEEKLYFVDEIGANSFKDNDGIKEIRTYLSDFYVLADAFNGSSLEKIEFSKILTVGARAFKGTNVKNVTFSNKLINMASASFEDCTLLESVDMSDVSGTPLKTLPERTFFGCSKLLTVHLSLSTTEIGVSSFEGCTKISDLNFIRDSYVTSIGNRAFAGCTSLDKITIPEKIVSYGTQMFDGTGITEITLTYLLTDAGYTNVKFTTFFGDLSSSLKKVTIVGDKVTTIEKSYFSGYSKLTDFVMSNSITEIKSSAFYGCSSLTNITFSTALYGGGIKIDAFSGSAWYANLSNVDDCVINNTLVYVSDNFEGAYEVLDGVTYIVNGVFKNKTKITSVSIPASVEVINVNAFDASSISSIIIDDGNLNYGVSSGTMQGLSGEGAISYSALYKLNSSGEKTELIAYFADKNGGVLMIPTTVETINDTSFDISCYPSYVYVQSEDSQVILDSYSNVSYIIAIENVTIKNNKNIVNIYKYLPQTSASGDNYSANLVVDGDEVYADFGFKSLTGLNFVKVTYNNVDYYYLVNHTLKTVQKINLVI